MILLGCDFRSTEDYMAEPEKITIIEGPPPTFQVVNDPLLFGISEGTKPTQIVMCRLRTHNGPALIERCYRTWNENQSITLEFRSEEGMTNQAPIVAARWTEEHEGHLLMLWLAIEDADVEIELGIELDDYDDDFSDLFDDLPDS
jgi:hypothetical protein